LGKSGKRKQEQREEIQDLFHGLSFVYFPDVSKSLPVLGREMDLTEIKKRDTRRKTSDIRLKT
jgi:hypothetical protein